MGKGTYKITLSDGTELRGLGLNGNNFVSKTEIKVSDFAGKLSHVVIEGTGEDSGYDPSGEYDHMELLQVTREGDEWWFVLFQRSERELAELRSRGDIEYIAMMTGVEL